MIGIEIQVGKEGSIDRAFKRTGPTQNCYPSEYGASYGYIFKMWAQ